MRYRHTLRPTFHRIVTQMVLVAAVVCFFHLLNLPVFAFVPAWSTNVSSEAIYGGLNLSDTSTMVMQWFANESYTDHVAYYRAGSIDTGVSKGALVHFSEDWVNKTTPGTQTPWIALISCDANATTASPSEDIFKLARNKGAVGVLLYSLFSLACVINPDYPHKHPTKINIFATQSLTSSLLTEFQFFHLDPGSDSDLGDTNTNSSSNTNGLKRYDAQLLDAASADVADSVRVGYPVSPGYMLMVLEGSKDSGRPRSDLSKSNLRFLAVVSVLGPVLVAIGYYSVKPAFRRWVHSLWCKSKSECMGGESR